MGNGSNHSGTFKPSASASLPPMMLFFFAGPIIQQRLKQLKEKKRERDCELAIRV
jgi:hypothetical protein